MNNSKTPKLVIGVGLAAVYAAGLGYFTLRGAHDNVMTQTSTVSSTQIDAGAVPSTGIVPELTQSSTSVVEQPAAVDASSGPVASTVAKANTSPVDGESDLKQSNERLVAPVTIASSAQTTGPKSDPISDPTTAMSDPAANSSGDAPAAAQATSASGNDSRITAEVKSQIAVVAPDGAIDVTTTDGVVELTGSVPSEEVVDKARLAARNVAAVRDVDVSALTISN